MREEGGRKRGGREEGRKTRGEEECYVDGRQGVNESSQCIPLLVLEVESIDCYYVCLLIDSFPVFHPFAS